MAQDLMSQRDPLVGPGMRPTGPVHRRSSVVAGSVWMVVISLLLFFVPLVNGLIGGLVGGYKVGTVGRALGAAVLPAVVVAVGLWLLFVLVELPIVGVFAGAAVGLAVALSEVGLFIGAAIGGWLSSNHVRRRVHV